MKMDVQLIQRLVVLLGLVNSVRWYEQGGGELIAREGRRWNVR